MTADTTVNLSLTVTNAAGTSTATTTVLVKAALPPTVNHVTPISVASGANGSFVISGTDPNSPPMTPLTFTVTQAGAPALTGLTVTNQACSPLVAGQTCAKVTFTAPVLPVAQVLPSVINLTIKATNTLGQASLDEFTTVTVNPLADTVNITNAEYRTGKQRLIITATSNVISPNVILTLQPYATTTAGVTFTPPDGTLTNGGGGLYTITLVGPPQPAAGLVLQVKSNHGGLSPFHALDRVRA